MVKTQRQASQKWSEIHVFGRSPTGEQLSPGLYTLRVIAYPTDGGPETIRSVHFTIK